MLEYGVGMRRGILDFIPIMGAERGSCSLSIDYK